MDRPSECRGKDNEHDPPEAAENGQYPAIYPINPDNQTSLPLI